MKLKINKKTFNPIISYNNDINHCFINLIGRQSYIVKSKHIISDEFGICFDIDKDEYLIGIDICNYKEFKIINNNNTDTYYTEEDYSI